MNRSSPILVATEAVADADLITSILREDFDNVRTSTRPEAAVADFEQFRPSILILAFDSLAKAQNYYLGLYRLSSVAPTIAHRTVILCSAPELWQVYNLCRQGHYDDYVLFWPASGDAPRLRMAVHQLLRQHEQSAANTVSAGQLAAGSRVLVRESEALSRQAVSGGEHVDNLASKLVLAQHEIVDALADIASAVQDAIRGESLDTGLLESLAHKVENLKADAVPRHMASANAGLAAMQGWAGDISAHHHRHQQARQALQDMVEAFEPLVFIVDDDSYQHKLLERMLADVPLRLMFAGSGLEALAMMRQLRPDLVLMDVEMPDISGIEATRRLRRIPLLHDVPVIMITGHSERSLVVECLKAGASDFVVKPLQKALLVSKINAVLGSEEGRDGERLA